MSHFSPLGLAVIVAAVLSVGCSGAVPGVEPGVERAAGRAVPLYSAPPPDGAELVVAETDDTGIDDEVTFVDSPGIDELNGFYFVLHHDGPYLLLHESITKPAGAPVPIPYREGEYAVAAWAPYLGDSAALGERAAAGQDVVLYREDGVACSGTTRDPVVFYRGMPARDADSSSRFIAAIAEGYASSVVLAAPVTVNGGDCEGALWARPALLPPPRIFVPDGDRIDLGEGGLAEARWALPLVQAVRALPEYRQEQKEWNSEVETLRDLARMDHTIVVPPANLRYWDESDGAERSAQRYVDIDDGSTKLVSVELYASTDRARGAHGVWGASRDGTTIIAQLRQSFGTETLADIDDDGVPEVLEEGSLDFRTERGWTTVSIPPAYRLCRPPAFRFGWSRGEK
jgi:hypothetical protein